MQDSITPDGFWYEGAWGYHYLAALSESNALPGRKTVIPSFVLRFLFGGGALREVYTDEDIRITDGSDGKNLANDYLYDMTRVQSD